MPAATPARAVSRPREVAGAAGGFKRPAPAPRRPRTRRIPNRETSLLGGCASGSPARPRNSVAFCTTLGPPQHRTRSAGGAAPRISGCICTQPRARRVRRAGGVEARHAGPPPGKMPLPPIACAAFRAHPSRRPASPRFPPRARKRPARTALPPFLLRVAGSAARAGPVAFPSPRHCRGEGSRLSGNRCRDRSHPWRWRGIPG